MFKINVKRDDGFYTPFSNGNAAPTTQASSSSSSSSSYSASSSSSSWTPSSISTSTSSYNPPTTTTSTLSAPSSSWTPSSTLIYSAPTTSPLATSSTSASSISVSTPSTRLPNSITLSRPGSTPTPTSNTSLLPLATATPVQLNSVDSFFNNLASSPMNIALTAIVTTGIFIVLLVIISFIIRKCILKRRRKRVTVGEYEKSFGSESNGEWLGDEKRRPTSQSSEESFSSLFGPRMPHSESPFVGLSGPRPNLSSSRPAFINETRRPMAPPAAFRSIDESREVPQTFKSFHLPNQNQQRTTRPPLPIAPTPNYPVAFKPFALPSPISVVPPTDLPPIEEERRQSWPEWIYETSARASAALTGPRAPILPIEAPASILPVISIAARRIAKVNAPILPAYQETTIPPPPIHGPFAFNTRSFGQRAMELSRSVSNATSINSNYTHIPATQPGVSKQNRSRLFEATSAPLPIIQENPKSNATVVRSRTMLSSSGSEVSIPPAVKVTPKKHHKSRGLKIRNSLKSVKSWRSGTSSVGSSKSPILTARQKMDRARALRKEERGY